MAKLSLTQLLGAIQGSLGKAQVAGHLASRDFVNLYASDEILKAYKVPNFEFESIDVDVPILPVDLVARDTKKKKTPVWLSATILLKRARLSAVKQKLLTKILISEMGLSSSQAKEILGRLPLNDVPLLMTFDVNYAKSLLKTLQGKGVEASLERQQIDQKMEELVVTTDLPENAVPMMLRIRFRPSPLKLVKDGEMPGEKFLLEPAD